MKKVFAFVLTLLTFSNALSFGNEGINPSTDSGTLQVRITDKGSSNFGLIIDIVNVEVYNDQMGWVTLNEYQQSISSLSFTNGDESLLANAIIPFGTYSKLRLTFGESNSIQTINSKNRMTNELKFQSENERQVVIPINEHVFVNDTNAVLINFDISNSIELSDNIYSLNPVIEEMASPTDKLLETVIAFNSSSEKN